MKQVVKFRSYLIFFTAVLFLFGCQNLSEKGPVAESNIHTLVHKETTTFFPFDFELNTHTVYLVDKSDKGKPPQHLAQILRSKGFNISADRESADYIMRFTAYVTMPTDKEGQALPYSAEFLLSMRENLPVIRQLLIQSDDTAGKQMKSMAKLVRNSNRGILGSEVSNVISTGTTFGGFTGGFFATATAGVVDSAASIFSQSSIQEGLAGFEYSMTKNSGVLNQVFGLNVYAASTTPEKPEALLDAVIARVADEFKGNE